LDSSASANPLGALAGRFYDKELAVIDLARYVKEIFMPKVSEPPSKPSKEEVDVAFWGIFMLRRQEKLMEVLKAFVDLVERSDVPDSYKLHCLTHAARLAARSDRLDPHPKLRANAEEYAGKAMGLATKGGQLPIEDGLSRTDLNYLKRFELGGLKL
jgi:hypothetical protein